MNTRDALKEMLNGNKVDRWCGDYVLSPDYVLWLGIGSPCKWSHSDLSLADFRRLTSFNSVSSPKFNELPEEMRKQLLAPAPSNDPGEGKGGGGVTKSVNPDSLLWTKIHFGRI